MKDVEDQIRARKSEVEILPTGCKGDGSDGNFFIVVAQWSLRRLGGSHWHLRLFVAL